ncbi:MAG: MlaD family protein [Desulfuromonadaceae bacterium]|nr:MlaD family protein [Desulfuromonadaceae bacterium]
MEPKAHHVLIGLFVVVSAGAALLFALWLSDSDKSRDYANYVVCFGQAVSGLAEGNSVLYSGIKVGDVVKLGLDSSDPRNVRAEIRVYKEIPVKEDTTASLTLVNITGSMSIQLSGGTPQSKLLRSETDNPAIIRADPSPLSSLLASGEDMVKGVGLLLNNANSLFSQENVEAVSQILANLETVSTEISGQTGAVAEMLHSVERAANQTEETLAGFTEVGSLTQSLLEGDGARALASARHSMDNLNAVTADIHRLLNEHDGSLAQGFKGLGEISPVMRELRTTLENLSRITRHIEENPTEFIIGRGSVQEFSP